MRREAETPGEIARTIRQDPGSGGDRAPRPWPVAAWVLAASCVLVVAVAGIAALRGGLWAGQAEAPAPKPRISAWRALGHGS